jgi:DNA polymerase I-like protein with 3'-5' exonuclease and polymerase domains
MYGGPDVDFGYGKDKIIWIDNLPKDYEQHLHANGRNGVLDVFKSWFNDPNRLKVWHNYGFDRHVMYNEQIDCLGFGGDTMHMARLWNTNRDKAQGIDEIRDKISIASEQSFGIFFEEIPKDYSKSLLFLAVCDEGMMILS